MGVLSLCLKYEHVCSLLWLGLVVVTVDAAPHCVEILDAGVLPLIKGHIGVHFYVSVNNRGPDPTEVQVTSITMHLLLTYFGNHRKLRIW